MSMAMKVESAGQSAVAALSAPSRAAAPEPPAPLGQGGVVGQQPAAEQAQDEFISAARALRAALGPMAHTEARFRVDTDSKRVQIEIVDQNTGDVVRQIPSDTLVRFAQTFDILLGLNVDETV